MFAAFLTTILFSISVVCGHRSAKMIGGTEANFWRLTSATIMLSVWAFGFGIGLGGDAFPVFLVSGIVGIGIGDVALFQALPRLGSRLSLLLIQCLTAPFAALIEWLWLGTTLSSTQIIWGLTALIGVGIALMPGKHLTISRRDLFSGILASIIAALGGAYGAVLSRKAYAISHAAHQPIDGANAAFQRILGGLLIAAVCLLIVKRHAFRLQSQAMGSVLHFFRGRGRKKVRTDPIANVQASKKKWRAVWPWVLMNSLAGQTLGVSCMQLALEAIPTGIVLAIIAITPIVVIPFTFVLEHERPTLHSLFGGIVAVVGVVGLTLSR